MALRARRALGAPIILGSSIVIPTPGGLAWRPFDSDALPWLPATSLMIWSFVSVTCAIITQVTHGLRVEVREARRLGQYVLERKIRAPDAVDARTDLYALGAVADSLLAGRELFDGQSIVEVCSQHLHQKPAPLSEHGIAVPAELEAIVLACLEKDPARRPQCAAALRPQLEACRVEPWGAEDARVWWLVHQAKLERAVAPSASGPMAIAVHGLQLTAVRDGLEVGESALLGDGRPRECQGAGSGAVAAPRIDAGPSKLSYASGVLLARAPRGPLRPFVQQVWITGAGASPGRAGREHVLPTGSMHIVLRLDDEPVRVWGPSGQELALGCAVIGGIRSSYYVKDARPARTIGAQLHAAASLPLLGIPADELAERHTRLDDVWGAATAALRARLQEARSPEAALACFETALQARLPRLRAVHPAIAHALARFDELADVTLRERPNPRDPVGCVVADIGLSHRRFLTLFEQAVGLAPKRYCRVLRFQRAIAGVVAGEALGAVALDAGYSDQAHLTREFQALAGVSPGAYRHIAPERDHHVPVGAGSDFFKTGRRATPRLGS